VEGPGSPPWAPCRAVQSPPHGAVSPPWGTLATAADTSAPPRQPLRFSVVCSYSPQRVSKGCLGGTEYAEPQRSERRDWRCGYRGVHDSCLTFSLSTTTAGGLGGPPAMAPAARPRHTTQRVGSCVTAERGDRRPNQLERHGGLRWRDPGSRNADGVRAGVRSNPRTTRDRVGTRQNPNPGPS
jgi:hypothetical protein